MADAQRRAIIKEINKGVNNAYKQLYGKSVVVPLITKVKFK